uniref:Macaca fascicularis brain cDNA clone: QflA-22447, similar to human transcriptional adaptor 3 (NGG1 homolog, yeast)-like(TADA3L), transcript variant 2, mRNA, RefSeq: NM_133480.1 n=1 Tax=Macaca fascicularis TaxID=9541 RepID=I7GMI9_MACFA|nr:unnamed protein product [Macaca fascicularis]
MGLLGCHPNHVLLLGGHPSSLVGGLWKPGSLSGPGMLLQGRHIPAITLAGSAPDSHPAARLPVGEAGACEQAGLSCE